MRTLKQRFMPNSDTFMLSLTPVQLWSASEEPTKGRAWLPANNRMGQPHTYLNIIGCKPSASIQQYS